MVEKLKRILLLPIELDAKIDGYSIKENCIVSGQTYKRNAKGEIAINDLDCDMSNVAVDFYSVIYGIDKKELNSIEYGWIKGDTMNTHIRGRKPKPENISEGEKTWGRKYHCLANFWVLPDEVGRKTRGLSEEQQKYTKHSSTSRLLDSMDLFLIFLEKNYDYYFNNYSNYFSKIGIQDKNNSIDMFKSVHFLQEFNPNSNIFKSNSQKNWRENVYDTWDKNINARATAIAGAKIAEDLYNTLKSHI